MKQFNRTNMKSLFITLFALICTEFTLAQTWHSQKDYTAEPEDNGSIGTIAKVGIGFYSPENLRYPASNVQFHPEIPYLPQKPLHILGYEDPELGEFNAPIPGIRLDHRSVSETGGSSGSGGSNSRSGGPSALYNPATVIKQHVWDIENDEGELRFLKDGNLKFNFNEQGVSYGLPTNGAEYNMNVYGTLKVGLNTNGFPNDFIVTGISNFQGDLVSDKNAFFKDKVIIGDPELVHGGQTSSNSKLIVQGTGIFQEVVVDHVSEWNDKVFEDDYQLISLNEVENFVKQHKHLPDFPSEQHVKNEGYNLSEMDALLLKKIEELTLYVIELKKENAVLDQTITEILNK